jgi:hypothetical protein
MQMKLVTFWADGHKIELYNSLIGKETVKVDGRIVSSGYSILGMTHQFKLNLESGDTYRIKTSQGGFPSLITINLYRNDEAIVEGNNSFLGAILFGIGIGVIASLF